MTKVIIFTGHSLSSSIFRLISYIDKYLTMVSADYNYWVVTVLLCNCFFLYEAAASSSTTASYGNISKVEDAVNFHMYYGQAFKVIKNSIDSQSYLLIQSTSRMAARTKYCTSRIRSFIIPLSNYSVAAECFPVSFFELLGLLGSLKGIITTDSISSQCVLKLLEEGDIVMLNKSQPQQFQQFAANFISDIDDQAPQACNFATFAPSAESNPLQRAEWIKYLGAFSNMEARANQVYNSIKDNYLCLSRVAATKASTMKPTVAWMEYNNKGIWTFTKDVFKLKYVEDAGGENVDDSISKNTYNTSNAEDLDELHAILCTVDVVIDETYSSNVGNYTKSTFLDNVAIVDTSCFVFLASQGLWRYDKRIRNPSAIDWFDGAISQSQLVLADLIEVIFPTGNYTTTYFRNLVKEEGIVSINSDMCERNTSIAMDPTVVPCK